MSEPAKPFIRGVPAPTASHGAPLALAPLNLSRLMACAGEVAFSWDLDHDVILFDGHARAFFNLDLTGGRCQGAAFLLKIAAEDATRRAAAMSRPARPVTTGSGTPYRAVYSFHPGGRADPKAVMIEEDGRWLAGPDGHPILATGIMRIVTGRHQAEQRLRYRGEHDALTGQLNRATLFERLQTALDGADTEKSPIGFIVAAVNGLDTINETFGFAVGDELLAGTARILRRHLRARDELGRYASNKFGIIVHDCGPGVIRVVADRLMHALRSTVVATSVSKLPATLSIGGMSVTDPSLGAETVVSNALQALDRARSRRLDSFVAFEAGRNDDLAARQRNAHLASSLVTALDEDRLRLELQPIVDAKTGVPEHYECLLRLAEPGGALVSAGEFMPIAEQLGLSRLIDLRTLELATRLLIGYPTARLALNVSGLTSGDNEWLVSLHRLTGGNRRVTERLTIEITETAAIEDLDQLMVFSDTIKELGCQVSIDDFGVGYTNFRILKLLKADVVKIDGTFIKNVCNDPGDQVFVKSMVELARTFKMTTVAEWVGDEPTARFLTEAGIDLLQGFYFGAPAPPEKLLGPPAA